MGFEFGFKDLHRVRQSDVYREVIPERKGLDKKRPFGLLTSFSLWGQT